MLKKLLQSLFLIGLLSIFLAPYSLAENRLVVPQQSSAPTIDGVADEAVWANAAELSIVDSATGKTINLKTFRDDQRIYFLATYPDADESRLHKPWVWDKELELYDLGPQREDNFAFKWNLEDKPVDLSNFADNLYRADVWYWKANRTDPVGYADDKLHILQDQPGKKAKQLTSKGGQQRYLIRLGDVGDAAQKKRILVDYEGDIVDQYESTTPSGSRADVHAKGAWKGGAWTIEFSRLLDTGNDDDIQFDPSSGKSYQFGVSILGLYAEEIPPGQTPGYGKGRISDPIMLEFK